MKNNTISLSLKDLENDTLEKKENKEIEILPKKKETFDNDIDENHDIDDIHFVNSLYGAANFTIPKQIDYLFIIIISLVVSLIVWGNYAYIDELTRGDGKVIPSSKIR